MARRTRVIGRVVAVRFTKGRRLVLVRTLCGLLLWGRWSATLGETVAFRARITSDGFKSAHDCLGWSAAHSGPGRLALAERAEEALRTSDLETAARLLPRHKDGGFQRRWLDRYRITPLAERERLRAAVLAIDAE